MGVLPTSVTVHKDRVYLAEYPLRDEPARVLVSDDDGETWRVLLTEPDACHFHGIIVDPVADELWATRGDHGDSCAIGRIENDTFQPVGSGNQRWRAVDLAFTDTGVIWGMDCPHVDTIEMLFLPRKSFQDRNPTPIRVGTLNRSVYYAQTIRTEDDTWVAFATAGEIGDAVPSRDRGGNRPPAVRVVQASASSEFREWEVIAEFRRQAVLTDYLPRLHGANGYVFLGSHPEWGLLLNPYNTEHSSGEIFVRSSQTYEAQDSSVDPVPLPVHGASSL